MYIYIYILIFIYIYIYIFIYLFIDSLYRPCMNAVNTLSKHPGPLRRSMLRGLEAASSRFAEAPAEGVGGLGFRVWGLGFGV